MPGDGRLGKDLARLSRARATVESSLKQAARAAKKRGVRNVNLATRVNKAVTTNIGERDTVRGASSRLRVAQDPGVTDEVSETTSVQVSHRHS